MTLRNQLDAWGNAANHPWFEKAAKHLPAAVAALLVLGIAWQLVDMTWLLITPKPRNAVVNAPAAMTSPAGPKVDPQTIANAHLFGSATAEAPQSDVANAPQTQMNLVLAGTIASDDPEKGFAIIGESPANAKFYAVGATIGGSAKLHSVYPDRVILDRSGQLETLALPRQSAAMQPAPRANLPAAAPQNRFSENLRRLAETNPGAITEVIRPQPVFANGVQRGYRVYPGRNRQQFAKLGLQPGDLVTAINGTPLDDPARGNEVFGTLASSGRVSVTIERAGQTQQLTLNTAQIALPESPEPGATQAAPPTGVPPIVPPINSTPDSD